MGHNHQLSDVGLDGSTFTVRYASGCKACTYAYGHTEETLAGLPAPIAEAVRAEHSAWSCTDRACPRHPDSLYGR